MRWSDPAGDRPLEAIEYALAHDRTIDIITTGARTGQTRTTEIWFSRVGHGTFICGTPGAGADGRGAPRPRDWLANLKAHPEFWFCFKESLHFAIPARAREVTDPVERRRIMGTPATQWYREHVSSVQDLVRFSPIVEVTFPGLGRSAGRSG